MFYKNRPTNDQTSPNFVLPILYKDFPVKPLVCKHVDTKLPLDSWWVVRNTELLLAGQLAGLINDTNRLINGIIC